MGMDNKQGIVMAASLTLAVVAGTVTWHTLTRTDAAQAGETVRLEAPLAAGRPGPASGDLAQIQQRNRELEQEIASLRDQLARRGAEPPPAAANVAADAPVPAVAGPMFDDAQFAAALAKIDWATMGEVTKDMAPLLAELVAAMGEDGAEVPMELIGKIQQLNGKLLGQVPAMLEAGMPGYGPNGVYTHPLVAANTLASTLAASGAKLTPAQQQSLSGIVAAFAKETQQIAGASREFAVEQLLEEVEMKDRFYREMSGLLTPEQLGKVAPEGAGGYDGANLFGSGLVTQSSSVPVPAKDAADFARSASSHLAEHLGLDEAAAAQVRTVLAQAMAAPELWNQRSDARELQLRMFRGGRTTTALRAQLQWMKQIQQQVALTPEQVKKLTGMRHVLVPLPR
jgi:cell division septum initiation protein DivIVA